MGVNCFLIPFQPDEWETAKSNLKIDPSELKNAILEKWPDTTIYPKNDLTTELLLWSFNHKGGPGRNMELLSGGQIVHLGIDAYLFEFIHWYRSFIPNKYRFYFTCACYHESYYLQIFESTTESDLEKYYSK